MSEATQARGSGPRELAPAIAFSVLGVALGVALILTREQLYRVQGGVSEIAGLFPFGYAYGAGMVAAANPCGILLLPSLAAFYLAKEEQAELTGWARAGKAVLLGGAATLGFVALFAVVGSFFAAGGRALGSYFPAGGLVIGVILTVLGLWMVLTGRTLGLASASRAMGAVPLRADVQSLFIFGLAYGVASLACTLPVFLVVVGTTLTVNGPLEALGGFVGYGLGMGSMLTTVIVAAAFCREGVTRWLRSLLPYLHRVAAALLLGAGIFVIHYWLGPSGLAG